MKIHLKCLAILILLANMILCNSIFASSIIQDISNAHFKRDLTNLNAINLKLDETQAYEIAYANYRMSSLHIQNKDKKSAKTLLDQAEELLNAEIYKKDSLAYSLLGSVYSLKAGLGAMSGAVYGKKSNQSIKQAEKFDPDNPQVWLVKGLSAYHTPGIFGGSKKKALQHFNKAISLFENKKNNSLYWGLEETLVWRAILQKKNGESDLSIKDLEHALSLKPEFVWAAELLAQFKSSR